ncbi:hypothetical protein M9458_033558, partial [Cirrhinus mrigala]
MEAWRCPVTQTEAVLMNASVWRRFLTSTELSASPWIQRAGISECCKLIPKP